MLSYLRIKNFALVEDMEISFYTGLNVLTGETGAGKSILINAIRLLLGGRASTEMIRQGSEKALLESVFFIGNNKPVKKIMNSHDIEISEEIIISREIAKNGRSLCRINGNLVPVNHLKIIGSKLVDLHGQFQQQYLLNNDNQLFILDEFDDKSKSLRSELEELVKKQRYLITRLNNIGKNEEEREKKLELLNHQCFEIEEAKLSKEEEEALKNRQKVINNVERIINTTKEAYYSIYEGNFQQQAIIDALATINKNLDNLAELDDNLSSIVENLKSVEIMLIDTARELKSYTDGLYVEPGEKEIIEERLEVYRNLKEKYGNSLEDILTFYDKAKEELATLQNSAQEIEEMEKQLEAINENINQKASMLSKHRRENAETLTKLLQASFKDVALEKGRFKIKISKLEKVAETGKEKIEFLFSANPGEQLLPLNKIISGGEMSRVMLALKSVLAGKDNIDTLIFDEIDSGIGGMAAQKISDKLKETAKYHQIICVTHNPQIAAKAHQQFLLYKETKKERTYTKISELKYKDRVNEIARMLDGSVNELSIVHARSLLTKEN